MSKNSKRVGLVIGSGGVKCAAALGLLSALNEADIEVDLTVGCSGGSLYTATIALGYSVPELQAMTARFWTPALMKGYTANLNAFQSGKKRFTQKSGLVDDGPILETLDQIFSTKTFADVALPLYIVATDFANGQAVVIDSGSIKEAVRASIAIPTIFPPWEIDGRLLDWLRPAGPAALAQGDPRGTACFPLVPYSNRIRDGRFVFEGREIRLPRNFGDHPHSIHGHGWQAPWRVAEAAADAAVMEYRHRADAWPFDYDARQHVRLDGDAGTGQPK